MTGLGFSCGACKFLRRRCSSECIFAPYFCYDQAVNHFSAVHKVFGASNVSKLLLHLPLQNRSQAAITISYEALARIRDPIYGCVAHIFTLQQQVESLQQEIDLLGNQMVNSIAFDVPSNYRTSHEIYYPDAEYQVSSQMNIDNYVSQQIPFHLQAESLEADETFDSQINIWEEQTSQFYNDPNISEILFDEIDHNIFMHFACINSGNDILMF